MIAHIILYAIVPILVVMLAGFISGKRHIFSDNDTKKFNKVVLNYALPSALFISIVQADRHQLAADLRMTIVAAIGIVATFMAVYYVFRSIRGNSAADGAIAALISGSPTIGFLGFAVLEPIFGVSPRVALVVAIVGIIVNAISIPLGLSLLNAGLSKSSSDKPEQTSAFAPVIHALAQPLAWAPILAVVWVLLGIPWPKVLSPSFELMAKANASLAVFSAGITLSSIKLSLNGQAVLGSVMKMIVMPAVVLLLGLAFHLQAENLKMLVIAASLPPAFSGIIIGDEYNTYVATGTTSLLLSLLLFIGFCPLWYWIADMATHFL
jgi:hypothetical protein